VEKSHSQSRIFYQVLLCVIEIQKDLATTVGVFDCFLDLVGLYLNTSYPRKVL